jgi:hypothetical protein
MLIDRRSDPLGMIGIRTLNALRMTVVNQNGLVSISAKTRSCLAGWDVLNTGAGAGLYCTRVVLKVAQSVHEGGKARPRLCFGLPDRDRKRSRLSSGKCIIC